MNGVRACDREWLLAAIEESRRCPPSMTAYAVGAVIVDADGRELARGYSRDTDPHTHAEESALNKLTSADLRTATIFSSLEPCSARKSRPRTCTQLIIAAGIRRVVFALREPPIFVDCHGAELLHHDGIEVVEIAELADQVQLINQNVINAGHNHERP